MSEQTETAPKPPNVSKLEQDMSAAPFFGVQKIEFEESYQYFEEQLTNMEKDPNLKWMDFFEVEAELNNIAKEDALIVVETKKFKCLYMPKPGYHPRKFKGGQDMPTPFLTWQEIVDRFKLWKKKKFKYNLKMDNPEMHCVNRNFRHVHLFKHQKGWLFANYFDMTYPDAIMQSCIRFDK